MHTCIDPGRSFSSLPIELYISISELLETKDLNSFIRTNTTAHSLLNNALYRRDAVSANPISLFWASTRNNPSTALKALSAGFDINSKTDTDARLRGCTPILLACVHNSLAVLKILLLNDEALPNSRDQKWHRPPISWAVKEGHVEILKALLDDERTDVNLKDKEGDTAIMIAVDSQPRMLEILLSSGRADPRIANRRGWTPLRLAACDPDSEVGLLLARHLRLILDGNDRAPHCQHVFFYAAITGHLDVVQYLVTYFGKKLDPNAGAQRYARDERYTGVLCGRGAFSIAAANGRVDVVKFLLEWSATEPNLQTPWKRETALFIAASDGNEELVKALIGCERVGLDIPNTFGTTPLAAAAATGGEGVVRLLLGASRPVDPNACDENGQTPLMIAAIMGDMGAVQALLDAPGIDPQLQNSDGKTAWEMALDATHHSIAQVLQEHIPRKS